MRGIVQQGEDAGPLNCGEAEEEARVGLDEVGKEAEGHVGNHEEFEGVAGEEAMETPHHFSDRAGDAFKLFMVAYMSFRLLCDFIKPYPRIFLGLGGIQWACLLILLYYSRDITRWLRPVPSVANPNS